MNVISKTYNLTVEKRQVEECLMGMFHTILFRRSQPKLDFTESKLACSYAVGDLGIHDEKCEYVDAVYCRCSSAALHANLKARVKEFTAELSTRPDAKEAEVRLVFYRKSSGWFSAHSPWEEWVVQLSFTTCKNEKERQESRLAGGRLLCEMIRSITFAIGSMSDGHMPEFTDEKDVATVYDTQYDYVTPFWHEINYSFGDTGEDTVGTFGKLSRIVRSTLVSTT